MCDPAPEIVIVGGGAAGFFAAIACKEANRSARVTILESSSALLSKVRISGGGRCNVTHDQPDPTLLVRNYPRGGRALLGPFTRFGPRETVAWFEQRGVPLKTEADGRMFPTTDDSGTIIDCLVGAARAAGVEVRTRSAVIGVEVEEGEAKGHEAQDHGARVGTGGHVADAVGARFALRLQGGGSMGADRVLLATGGAPAGYRWAAALGHTIEPLAPSLFTLKIDDPRLRDLAGVSVQEGQVRLEGAKETHEGPVLITHWGLSGPAILKASAWGARLLHERSYQAGVTVNWRADLSENQVREALLAAKRTDARRGVLTAGPLGLPQRLWRSLATAAGADQRTRWGDVSKVMLAALAREVHAGRYEIGGKGVFKEEFVTCGGVRLKEIDFTSMASRVVPGLYFAGEILDIDGVTGGFNFQSAWTTGWQAGRAMAGGTSSVLRTAADPENATDTTRGGRT